MKIFVVVSVLLVAVAAKPSGLIAQSLPTILTASSPILTQYHAQDELGQYTYGYNGGLSSKIESKSLDGITRGSYSYVDGEGRLQTTEYTADALNGFRAVATNLPKAPIDNGIAPEPIQETPEVALARAQHLSAFNEAAVRAAATPEEPEIKSLPSIEPATGRLLTPLGTPLLATPIGTTLTGAPLPGQIVSFRTAEFSPSSFAYSIHTPALAYHAPLLHTSPLATSYTTFAGAPILTDARSLPLLISQEPQATIVQPIETKLAKEEKTEEPKEITA